VTTPRAIVLSGGGARGAYEAGVLSVALERAGGGRLADFVCGTSIGALTGAWIAGALDAPRAGADALVDIWSSLALEDVLGFGPGQVLSLPRLFLGGDRPTGLFDSSKLARALGARIPWSRIGDHIAHGRLSALTVTATHVPTGRPTVFVQRRADMPSPDAIGRRVIVRDATIGLDHVLASGAIPVLFAPVRVDGDLYCDGGLRLNTPLRPAIRLGARKVLAIGLSTTKPEAELSARRYPGASFLLGKVLNAFLLDHVMSDLEELVRINGFLADGAEICGPDFAERLSDLARRRGEPAYHHVEAVVVRPSEDLSVIAADHLRRMRRKITRVSAARVLIQALDSHESAGSDVASYLLFDGKYARDLVELGRRDAFANLDQIDRFLAD